MQVCLNIEIFYVLLDCMFVFTKDQIDCISIMSNNISIKLKYPDELQGEHKKAKDIWDAIDKYQKKEKKNNAIIDKLWENYNSPTSDFKWCGSQLTKEQIRSFVLAVTDFRIHEVYDEDSRYKTILYNFKNERGENVQVMREIRNEHDDKLFEDLISISSNNYKPCSFEPIGEENSDLVFKNPPLCVFAAFFYHCFE